MSKINWRNLRRNFLCWIVEKLMGKGAFMLAIDNGDNWVTISASGQNGKLTTIASQFMYRDQTQQFFLQAAADHMTEMQDLIVEAERRLQTKPYKERVVN